MTHNLAPFAAVNALINQGVQQSLADAICSVDGGRPFAALYHCKPTQALDIYSGNAPTLSFALDCAPSVGQGSVVVVQSVGRFEVTQPVEHDATGWVTLELREAPAPLASEGVGTNG